MQGVSSIFNWIILSSLMGSLLVFLILAVKFAFKNTLSANWHYYIWFLLLLRLIIPFTPESPVSMYNFVQLASLENAFNNQNINFTELKNLSTETGNSPGKLAIKTIPSVSNSSEVNSDYTGKPTSTNSKVIKWNAALIILWLIGVVLLIGYTIFINLKLWYQIRTEIKTNNTPVAHILENCKSELKITKNISVIITSKAHTPALFGPIKPWLLVPDSFIQNLTNTELEYIILHELAHWKRKDIIINWITAVLQILHWFNPIIWYGFYRMHQDCELACDALVLSSIDSARRKEYGRTIIHVLEMMLTPQWIPGTARLLSQKSDFKRRISMISKYKKGSLFVSIIAISMFILVGVVGCTNVPNTNVFQSNSKTEKGTYNQMLAGTVNVEGPGVVVTLSDGKSPTKDDPNSFIVHDADLRNIVNQLTFAGAEAISINGERLIATSSIRAAGTSVLINGNQYTSPFVIKAIGNSKMMINSLELQSGVAYYIQKYGMKLSIKKAENLSIPKYKGKVNFKYAKPIEN